MEHSPYFYGVKYCLFNLVGWRRLQGQPIVQQHGLRLCRHGYPLPTQITLLTAHWMPWPCSFTWSIPTCKLPEPSYCVGPYFIIDHLVKCSEPYNSSVRHHKKAINTNTLNPNITNLKGHMHRSCCLFLAHVCEQAML